MALMPSAGNFSSTSRRIRMSNANAFCRWPTMSRVPRGPHTCNGDGAALRCPRKQVELRQPDHVVGMKMRQEHLRHAGGVDRQPGETSHQASAAVEQQCLRTSDDQRADAQSLRIGGWTTERSEQYHLQAGVARRRYRLLRANRRDAQQSTADPPVDRIWFSSSPFWQSSSFSCCSLDDLPCSSRRSLA